MLDAVFEELHPRTHLLRYLKLNVLLIRPWYNLIVLARTLCAQYFLLDPIDMRDMSVEYNLVQILI